MKVYKFGGASVKNADAVRNVEKVVRLFENEGLAIVISAMGKTTNALEQLVDAYFHKSGDPFELLEQIKTYHYEIISELFEDDKHPVYDEVNNIFVEIVWAIEDEPTGTYDYEYDQIVACGEMLSTRIVSAFLNQQSIMNQWVDIRDLVRTDNTYRDAKVDWDLTQKNVDVKLKPLFEANQTTKVVTQGFIGVTSENFTSTLGREGSDFTAAILGYTLLSDEVTIWKDVPGVLNADPKWFDETLKLDHISYKEAIELSFYGASVIHPKTIKPVENKKIPFKVKSFLDPTKAGTVIDENTASDTLIPSFIFKMDQVLISISANDFSFIMEDNLSEIFAIFAKHQVKINLMQNSAINFSACINNITRKVDGLMVDLQAKFSVKYNEGLELVTIRHYDQATIDRVTVGKDVMVEQKSRVTARMVMKDLGWFDNEGPKY